MRNQGILHHYMTISYLLGFKEKWSLVLCTFPSGYYCHHCHVLFFCPYTVIIVIIFGGALVGFVLARSFMLDPRSSNLNKHLTPGSLLHSMSLESPNSLYLVVGEWFWDRKAPYLGALMTHAWTCFCEWAPIHSKV